MKKYILLLFMFCATITNAQTIRNSILGLYSGTYQNYDNWPDPPIPAGVKLTALPTDTIGMIVNDTINNIIDTIAIFLTYDLNWNVNDTIIYDYYQTCGDIWGDSLYYSRFIPQDALNPSAIYRLRCEQYTFPTSVNNIKFDIFNVYPNPVTDKILVELPVDNSFNYSVYSTTGQLVNSGSSTKNKYEINVADLLSGVYFLKISTGSNQIVKRIVKN